MKTLTYTDSRYMARREIVFTRPLKTATLLRRFQRYIETSDWDEQIIRKEPLFNKICLLAVVLSGLAISPFIVTALLK
jgi:hypothetical protein